MTALIVGTAIALVAVAYVLVPLFREMPAASPPAPAREVPGVPGQSTTAVAALREVEFDHATGKLSEADYQVLKARYTGEALVALRASESAQVAGETPGGTGTPTADDLAEQLIQRYRGAAAGCPTCGPRPEPDALYCSNCGRYLPGSCQGCGRAITEPSARFCASCGRSLAA
jgi:hypothetical protein